MYKKHLHWCFEINGKVAVSSVSEEFIAPWGTSTAYAVTTPTARFPFI